MNISTERLIIRPFALADAEDIHRVVREKNILRYMADWAEGKDTPRDYDEPIAWLARHKWSRDMRKSQRYAVALRATGEMIGMVGVGVHSDLREVEVAYFMAEAHQRQGYAKEALSALIGWIFKVSEEPYLIATVDSANEASAKTALACGFRLFEERKIIGYKAHNMVSDSYFYFRRYRPEME